MLRLLREPTLLGSRHEYRGAIARAFVTELSRGIEWVDIDPVMIEQVLVADDARIVGDLDSFVMAGVIAVAGVLLVSHRPRLARELRVAIEVLDARAV